MSMVEATATNLNQPAPAGKVRRWAFYLESRGQALFAWLHSSAEVPSPRHGVIICPPLGHEQIHAHRSLRHLADALACAGFAVVRLDYHGTGDSAGSDEDADRYATWLANIHDARAWLRLERGCTAISLVGVRLGAALAVEAAAANAVEGLLLWEPVLKGRLYVREMKALGLTAEHKSPPLPEAPDDVEGAGFVLTEQTVHALQKLDLLKSSPQCRRALLVARADMPVDTRLLEHLSALGIQTQQVTQPGYADMMAEPHNTKVPWQAIAGMVDWLVGGVAGEAGAQRVLERPAPTEALLAHASGRLRERLVHLSEQPDLFGILSEPLTGAGDHVPLVVLLNGGSAYRVGPNRFYVMLARQLAVRGFRALRLDLCGLGDSVTTDPDGENDTYAATAFRDIDLTLNYLRTHLGVERVVLMGLCSGAYFAFQVAAQLADPIVVESVLINPLTFFWKHGMTTHHATMHYYWKASLQPGKWLKFLTGQTRIGIIGTLKLLVERWRLRRQSRRSAALQIHPGRPAGLPAHPSVQNLTSDLEHAVHAGRKLTCFFSTSDPGHGILTSEAQHKVKSLSQAGKLRIEFIEGADHTFSARVPRRAAVQAIVEHLGNAYAPALRRTGPAG